MAHEVRVPTRKEIAKLPRWVQVAFAIRCALRVQSVFQADWPDAPRRHVATLERAIRHAEQLLNSGKCSAAAYDAAQAAASTAQAAYAIADAETARAAAQAAAQAAYAADAANEAATARVAQAVAQAAQAADTVVRTAHAANAAPIWRDFDMLKSMAEREHWTNKTRPSLESLGPLWLEGEEPNWKKIIQRAKESRGRQKTGGDQEKRLVLTAYVDESVDDDTLVEGITELCRTLNRYHILCGGSGLTIDDWQIRAPAGAPKGVPA